MISRHPSNIYASYINKYIRSYKASNELLPIFNIVSRFRELEVLKKIKLEIGVIILEELHAMPQESLKKISKYIRINYDDSLTQSTILGKLWRYGGWKGEVSSFHDGHKKIDIKTIGSRGEYFVFRCTGNFQKRLGYVLKNELNYKELLFSYIPDKQFFLWYKLSFESVIRNVNSNNKNFNLIYKLAKYFLRHIMLHPLNRLYEIYLSANIARKEDLKFNFENFNIITPVKDISIKKMR